MKRTKFFVPLALCLLATACQQDEVVSYNDGNDVVSINATMEKISSRSMLSDEGEFSWSVGDEIGVWTTSSVKSTFQTLSCKQTDADGNGKGIFEGVLEGDNLKFSQYAVYPYSAKHSISEEGTLTVTLPDTYNYTTYVPNTNALMVANIGTETPTLGDLHFYHAGGVVSVKLKNLPVGTCGVRLTTNQDVTGEFSVAGPETTTPTIAAATKTSKNVITIKFNALTSVPSEAMQFFFPVPVGNDYTFTLEYLLASQDANNPTPVTAKVGTTPNDITRSLLLLMPTLTVTSTGATGESAGYVETTVEGQKTYVIYTSEGLNTVNELVKENPSADIVLAKDIEGEAEANTGYGTTGISHTNGGVIDGNGNTLTVTGAGSTWDSAICTKGGTIKNITIDGGFRGIFIAYETEKVIIDNVTINPLAYSISIDGATGYGLEVTNSTLNGWTSFSAAIGEVSFTNCTFGSNGSYAYLRPYGTTLLTDCTFSEGYELDASQAAEGAITLENCKMGETLITKDNLTTLLGEDAAKAIVK